MRRGQLRRLALRCSRFLESSLKARKELYHEVKKFYGGRSSIVHGDYAKIDHEIFGEN
jgi:hypothetical protein